MLVTPEINQGNKGKENKSFCTLSTARRQPTEAPEPREEHPQSTPDQSLHYTTVRHHVTSIREVSMYSRVSPADQKQNKD